MEQRTAPQPGSDFPHYPQTAPSQYYMQSPQPQQRKPKPWPWIIALIAVFLVGFVAGKTSTGTSVDTTSASSHNQSNSGTQTTATTQSRTQTTATTQSGDTHHKVSETVSINNTWQVTVNSVKSDSGDRDFNVPKSGNVFLLITVTMKNISTEQQDASGFIQYTLRDTDGTGYNESGSYGKDPGGKVAVGNQLKGVLAYEVPVKVKQFQLGFESDLTSNMVLWDISL